MTRFWKPFVGVALSLCLAVATGCSTTNHAPLRNDSEIDILKLVDEAATDLVTHASSLQPDKTVIAATFVNIDNLQQSSTLGRTLSEMFASSLVRSGVSVIEVKMRDSLFIQEDTGELMLSRDVHRLSASHDAQAILIGTYAQGDSYAYVNARIIRASDNMILGATNFTLPMSRNVRSMLPMPY
ncbi:FlgO family outer membrane protein [Halomonas sp. WWR20]